MTEYKGILEITDYAQELINKGQARIEGSNVVWNSGSGHTGVVEWGKFHLTIPENNTDSKNAMIGVGIAIGTLTGAGVSVIVYNALKARQDKANEINNKLISCLSLYILELKEGNVQPSTRLDLELAIEEYINSKRLFKNKVDNDLLGTLDIVLNNLKLDDNELNNKIIHLNDFIEQNNQRKLKKKQII